jgi:putative Mn2+ efflux pump MntP
MEFWIEQFFGNSYGLSVTIGFIIMLGIGVWFVFFFIRKMKQSEAEQLKNKSNHS